MSVIKEIEAKSILSRNKRPEHWFGVHYNVNLYRGCQHGCIYCDSRSDCYHVENFDREVLVKVNGAALLEEALAKKRKRVTIGTGAMSDCYMPVEKKYELTRQCIELVHKYRMRLHIATKSKLILRDIDLIEKVAHDTYANVAVTITTAEDDLARLIEPGATSPTERFEVLRQLRERKIIAGVLMQPQLPWLMEDRKHIDGLIEGMVKADVSFVLPALGMTLREGNRDYYYEKLSEFRPGLADKYQRRFGDQYGIRCINYDQLKTYFKEQCRKNGIKIEMPMYKEPDTGEQMRLF